MNNEQVAWSWKQLIALLLIVNIGMIGLGVLGIVLGGSDISPEITQTILLIAGVIALVATLLITGFVYKRMELSDPANAFGLPNGTIRAIIALGLVVIFSMASVYLYSQMRTPPDATVKGLTQEQVGAIPADQILSISNHVPTKEEKAAQKEEDASTPTQNAPVLYDVSRILPKSETSDDFAKQMLTTMGTLVVAVAGFYFGTQSVSTAKGVVAPVQPQIRSISIDPKDGSIPGANEEDKKVKATIAGKNFCSPKTVKLIPQNKGSEISLEDILSSDTKISGELTIPKSAVEGKYDLVVVNADGGMDTLEEAFTASKKKDTEQTQLAANTPASQSGNKEKVQTKAGVDTAAKEQRAKTQKKTSSAEKKP
jgi:hypothetical protein